MNSTPLWQQDPKRRIWRVLLDPRILAYNLGLLIAGPVVIAVKFKRYLRTRRERDFAKVRWWLPDPTPGLWKVEGRRSKGEDRRSEVAGRRSQVDDRRSEVAGRGSQVAGSAPSLQVPPQGHRSEDGEGRRSRDEGTALKSPLLEGSPSGGTEPHTVDRALRTESPITHHSSQVNVTFVCVSLGEAVMAKPIAKKIQEARPDVAISLSIMDPASLRSCREANWGWPLSYFPFDFLSPVVRWLKLTDPDLVVFVESTKGKGIAPAIAAYGAKIALINGRASNPFRTLYHVFWPLYRWAHAGIYGYYVLNERYARFRKPLARKDAVIQVLGNLKYNLPAGTLDESRAASLKAWLRQAGERPLLFAGSTEPEDEQILFNAYVAVRKKHDCRLVLAPRNPKRAGELAEACEAVGLSACRRTEFVGDLHPPTPSSCKQEEGATSPDVFILDTLGELAFAYQFGISAFIGGFIGHSGHNVLEPLRWGVPFVCGRAETIFEDAIVEAEKFGIGARVSSAAELAGHWSRELSSPQDRAEVLEKANAIIQPHVGVLQRTVDALLTHLPPAPPASESLEDEAVVSAEDRGERVPSPSKGEG